MCNYFSGIFGKDGTIYYTRHDDHSAIIEALKLKDGDYVRFEVHPIVAGAELIRTREEAPETRIRNWNYVLDHPKDETIPYWYERSCAKIQADCVALAKKHHSAFVKIKRDLDALYAKYNSKWDALNDKYGQDWVALKAKYRQEWDALYAPVIKAVGNASVYVKLGASE